MVFGACAPALRLASRETAPGEVWERLEQTRSFAFRLRYRTTVPVGIECSYDGRWQAPDREEWRGRVVRSGEATNVHLLAAGEHQYDMAAGGWRKSARGIETKVFDQARQALQGAEFELAGERDGRRVFRFVPKATVLDPTQMMKLEGRFEIDAKTGLPLVISYGDATGLAAWQMDFGRFNRAGGIRLPFVTEQALTAEPVRRLSSREWNAAARGLYGRLRRLGTEFRLRRGRAGFEIELADALDPQQLERLLCQGVVQLWEAEWVGPDMPNATGVIVAVGGDAARRVGLVRLVAANELLDATADLELPMRPELVVQARSTGKGSLAILMIDGAAVSAAIVDEAGRLRFGDLGSATAVEIIAIVARGPALPCSFRAALRSKTR
ncbi:MAG: hypothetical protein ABIK86_04280 [candidate division WOR-3 bacterium]